MLAPKKRPGQSRGVACAHGRCGPVPERRVYSEGQVRKQERLALGIRKRRDLGMMGSRRSAERHESRSHLAESGFVVKSGAPVPVPAGPNLKVKRAVNPGRGAKTEVNRGPGRPGIPRSLPCPPSP